MLGKEMLWPIKGFIKIAKEHICTPHGHRQWCGEIQGRGRQEWVDMSRDGGNGHLQ